MTDLDDFITEAEQAAEILGSIIANVPDRPLSADERAQLRAIQQQTRVLRGLVVVMLAEGDDATVVRSLMGATPEGQA